MDFTRRAKREPDEKVDQEDGENTNKTGNSMEETQKESEDGAQSKGDGQEASGLEALLSLANAAEETGKESESKGTKRPRPPDLSIQRKRVQRPNTKSEGPVITEGPGFCSVGNAPRIIKAKNSMRHVAIAYYIYYQQRKSMMECGGPSGVAAPVSLDPTLEARLLKERTEWMKRNSQQPQTEVLSPQQGGQPQPRSMGATTMNETSSGSGVPQIFRGEGAGGYSGREDSMIRPMQEENMGRQMRMRDEPMSRQLRDEPIVAGRNVREGRLGRQMHEGPLRRQLREEPMGRQLRDEPMVRQLREQAMGRQLHEEPMGRPMRDDVREEQVRPLRDEQMSRRIHEDRDRLPSERRVGQTEQNFRGSERIGQDYVRQKIRGRSRQDLEENEAGSFWRNQGSLSRQDQAVHYYESSVKMRESQQHPQSNRGPRASEKGLGQQGRPQNSHMPPSRSQPGRQSNRQNPEQSSSLQSRPKQAPSQHSPAGGPQQAPGMQRDVRSPRNPEPGNSQIQRRFAGGGGTQPKNTKGMGSSMRSAPGRSQVHSMGSYGPGTTNGSSSRGMQNSRQMRMEAHSQGKTQGMQGANMQGRDPQSRQISRQDQEHRFYEASLKSKDTNAGRQQNRQDYVFLP
ncbi:hypothetical protein AAMO2058_001485600 [Amorphochlora amoebiformis]|uniref:Uncharacterized protein n=1 Tax=Amorphochlora amoebiformis TaxID=1561963 RepID=A0A7S0CV95_9EUKA|mmetsp:Transcript_1322/g.1856  ORF Transcript_1322/g.1856 Transcript_1322/m.1856 type:complete len:626 (+) Transcript_1322:101-1978(+)